MKLPRTLIESSNSVFIEKDSRPINIFPVLRLKSDMVQSGSFPMETLTSEGRFTLNEAQLHPPVSVQNPLPTLYFLGKPEEFHERIIKSDSFFQVGYIVIQMGKADTDQPLPPSLRDVVF